MDTTTLEPKNNFEPHPGIRRLVSTKDYSPFGVVLKGRSWSTEEYRYGFNGKEKDDEFSVEDGSYDFGARMYDARISSFLSVDAMYFNYSFSSTYSFAACNPLMNIDVNGDEPMNFNPYEGASKLRVLWWKIRATLKPANEWGVKNIKVKFRYPNGERGKTEINPFLHQITDIPLRDNFGKRGSNDVNRSLPIEESDVTPGADLGRGVFRAYPFRIPVLGSDGQILQIGSVDSDLNNRFITHQGAEYFGKPELAGRPLVQNDNGDIVNPDNLSEVLYTRPENLNNGDDIISERENIIRAGAAVATGRGIRIFNGRAPESDDKGYTPELNDKTDQVLHK